MLTKIGPPIRESDVVIFRLPYPQRKRIDAIKAKNNRDGHRIHDTIERLGSATVKQISTASGYSVERVIGHVQYHMGLKKPRLEINRQP
jgi:hypothetical protein